MPDGPLTTLALTGHTIPARIVESDCLAVKFADLCGTSTSAVDYVVLARRYRRWTVGDVLPLRAVPLDWTTRFINLVDILYDADLELTLYASVPLSELAQDVSSAPDLQRTISRLSELQGHATVTS